jgi:hypothetical protein
MKRVLKPAAVEAGVGEWVGFHTFRHTCATMLLRSGWNAPQAQRLLGHSDPGFTLRRYVHLLDDDLSEPGFLDGLESVSIVSARPTERGRDPEFVEETVSA